MNYQPPLTLASHDYGRCSATELVAMIRYKDDPLAFEQLYERYHSLLCQRVQSMIGCAYKSEEIVSDVFVKIWNNRRALSISSSLKAYLFTAVRNQTIDYIRKQNRHRKVDGEVRVSLPSDYSSPEEALIFEEVRQAVEAAIDSLPPQGRHIFRLSRDHGLKYREIADKLNISIKTVETHMRRSLIALRRQLLPQNTG